MLKKIKVTDKDEVHVGELRVTRNNLVVSLLIKSMRGMWRFFVETFLPGTEQGRGEGNKWEGLGFIETRRLQPIPFLRRVNLAVWVSFC